MKFWKAFSKAEKLENVGVDTVYTNNVYDFTIRFPSAWRKRPLLAKYSPQGGQIAITEPTKKATLNVAVGPLQNSEWCDKEIRAEATKTWLTQIQPSRNPSIRYVEIKVDTSKVFAGETNCVEALYVAQNAAIEGVRGDYRCGLVSLYHKRLEYMIQWSTAEDYEGQALAIIDSFRWT